MSEISFEKAITQLAEIVEKLEGESLPLEKTLQLYEKGSGLVALCYEKLQMAEQRIVIIEQQEGSL